MRNRRPNLLFVFTDQQSALAVGGPEHPHVRTPAFESLANEGTTFTRSYCAAPVCGPSRACLVTGLAAHETGVRFNGNPLREDLQTFGERIRSAGYETAWSGKWHLPKSYPTEPDAIAGFENLVLPPTHPLLSRDIGYGWPGYALGANTDGPFVDEAIRFLSRPHERPFLLSVSLHNPHDICWWARKPVRLPGPQALPPLPPNFEIPPDEPEFLQICRLRDHYGEELEYTARWSDEDWRLYLHAYYRMTEAVDAEVGRLLNALDAQGLRENTLIVLTSDHGEGMAARKWMAKLALHEEVVRVPLVVAGPGVTHATSDALVSGLDLAPTFCDFAGVQPPDGARGHSLRPLLEQRSPTTARDFLVCTLDPDDQRPDMTARAVISRQYKYCLFSHGPRHETLHDLIADPGEQRNLAARPEFRHVLEEHRSYWKTWQRETGDRIPQGP